MAVADTANPGSLSWVLAAQTALALAEGRIEEALSTDVRSRARGPGGVTILELRARVLLAVGDREQAINFLEELLGKRVGAAHEWRFTWLAAHVTLGKILEGRGETTRARELYQKLLKQWKDGDPDLPLRLEAQRRLDALNRRTP